MPRIEVPAGNGPEATGVYALRPDLGERVTALSKSVYQDSILAPREREAVRMRIALINDCPVCKSTRVPKLAAHGVDEDLYAHVEEFRDGHGYSEREQLAIEYAERFALDHLNIDDAFFGRLRGAFSDAEILDLTICIGEYLAFGRLTQVLKLDVECALPAPTPAAN